MKVCRKTDQYTEGTFHRIRIVTKAGDSVEVVDPDELPLKDESDRHWVQAWHKEINENYKRENKRRMPTQIRTLYDNPSKMQSESPKER